MPLEPIIDENEDYASSEDSDFAPDEIPDGPAADESSDEEEEEGVGEAQKDVVVSSTKPVPAKRKIKQAAGGGGGDAEDAGFENSGDEAIIEKGKKKRRKKGRQTQGADQDDDDEGGEGGLIKTRSMRAVEKAERKTKVVTGPVTIDVDALWASMTAAPIVQTKQDQALNTEDSAKAQNESGQQDGQPTGKKDTEPSEMIKIKRTYKFAGKVHTEEKLVARDSAEAKLYLASNPEKGDGSAGENNGGDGDGDDDQSDKRMPRKAFRSIFEPVMAVGDQQNQRTDLNLGITMRLQAREAAKAKKLNTVEKSRMDWAGYVDKEGIKDELALAGRAKGAFADRQDFLARSEARRDEEARRVRLAGKV